MDLREVIEARIKDGNIQNELLKYGISIHNDGKQLDLNDIFKQCLNVLKRLKESNQETTLIEYYSFLSTLSGTYHYGELIALLETGFIVNIQNIDWDDLSIQPNNGITNIAFPELLECKEYDLGECIERARELNKEFGD